jgi:hypothetical protein
MLRATLPPPMKATEAGFDTGLPEIVDIVTWHCLRVGTAA